jgi:membrane protease YdiL (CAAX protease family)
MIPVTLINAQSMPLSEGSLMARAAVDPPSVRTPSPVWFEALFWTLAWVAALLIPRLILCNWPAHLGGGQELFENYEQQAVLCGRLLALGLTVFALSRRVGGNWMSAMNLRTPVLVPCLLVVLGLPAVLMGGKLVPLLEKVGGEGLDMSFLASAAFWFALLVTAVGPAVTEELAFRGFLGRLLLGRYGMVLGVLFTSVLFAMVHFSLPQAIFAFLFGIYAHLAYLATRSLWVPVLLHFLCNGTYVLAQFAEVRPNFDPEIEPTESQLLLAGSAILLALLGVIGAGWGLYRLGKRQMVNHESACGGNSLS